MVFFNLYSPLQFIKLVFLFLCFSSILISCEINSTTSGKLVKNEAEMQEAIDQAVPGDQIVLADGVWKDIQIKFTGNGTEDKPIILRAETPGMVFIEGKSDLKFGGAYLEVHDLYFRNGFTPSGAVVEFKVNESQLATHCKVSNCVIENFNQPKRDRKDHWVEFWGRHNTLDHCYIAGKSNEGPTIRIDIKGNQSINNYHQITNNHFGPRPRKGGPKAETIQIGDSFTSMSPSHTMISNNFFEKCNGEVEVISSKTNFNEFRNNVFYKCEGSLVTRHGNYCIIDGNYFIGDEASTNIGGVRLINTGHWVTNNYFYNLKADKFRSPLAIMNGIPKSPLNRYNQVTDVVVAHNTWVNCISPWHFGVGTNISEKDVLPLSEIRSATPIRTIVANNLIYNEKGDKRNPIIAHDKIDGIIFKNNIINNQGVPFEEMDGLEATEVTLKNATESIFVPSSDLDLISLYDGFDFENIGKDLFGNSRSKQNSVGAINSNNEEVHDIMDKSQYGAKWFSSEAEPINNQSYIVNAEAGDLRVKLNQAINGDTIVLKEKSYSFAQPLVINKLITILSQTAGPKSTLVYTGPKETPAFELHPLGNLNLQHVTLSGTGQQFAFASLKENMSSLYNLNVNDCEISNFNYVLKAYKESFADEITFSNTRINDCENGIELSEETNDKGDYNVEFLNIDECQFQNVKSNVIDYYRGGYDESTIGGNLSVTNSTFTSCGAREANGILLNTRGIINVDISNNTFKNNSVKLVALLWGAKNNSQSDNQIVNSGKIVTEENLKLKLVY